ncbi:unnamed protein product [Prorocentrum cordatum]|uniref:Uncharacterized protein n=1 Tax=Prorocentrum cordatum TaxID=2364126 RepID=A0ABN9VW64_9DINO|nr:unnamed protein product [Polarella glacialis]
MKRIRAKEGSGDPKDAAECATQPRQRGHSQNYWHTRRTGRACVASEVACEDNAPCPPECMDSCLCSTTQAQWLEGPKATRPAARAARCRHAWRAGFLAGLRLVPEKGQHRWPPASFQMTSCQLQCQWPLFDTGQRQCPVSAPAPVASGQVPSGLWPHPPATAKLGKPRQSHLQGITSRLIPALP